MGNFRQLCASECSHLVIYNERHGEHRMRSIIASIVLCLTGLVAQGQEVCRQPKIVKTTGTAELKVTPDQATIQLGVERQSATAKYAKAGVANTSRKILAALKELNIEDKD